MMLTAFSWIIDRKLAGSGRPGLLADLDDDLAFIESQGIRTIVSLTELRDESLARRPQFENLHFPIPDMSFPTPRFAATICERVIESMERGAVLLHCHAGHGRTGTIAACCLVALGETPERALLRVRVINPRYIQTPSQEQCIRHFARHLRETSPV
ncbi:protein-tyrosine phosphatase family protein [Nannocystaceae bacterium ST9]